MGSLAESTVTVRAILIEDSPHYRSSLTTFFRHAPGFELVAVFGSAEEALRTIAAAGDSGPGWDLALVDIELPGMNGIEFVRRSKQRLPDLRAVMVTVFEEPAVILEAIGAGADGYLLKQTSAKELLAQLRGVTSGGSPLTPGVARTVLDLLRTMQPDSGGPAASPARARLDLSEREQDVLRELVRGRSYSQVADNLGVSLNTVRTHVRAVYKKLQVHSVADAVRRAVRENLV